MRRFTYTAVEHGQQLRRYWTNACRTCAIKPIFYSAIY